MRPLRTDSPQRTCKKNYTSHRPYKSYLREDFRKRCGYCNDRDILCGGERGFHIDHFRPQSKFKHLKADYNNLVYSCPYCNIAKSNDWPSESEHESVVDDRGYIDPCTEEFANLFERFDNGRIRPTSPVGTYMFNQLKLGLRRHQLAWAYEALETVLKQLGHKIDEVTVTHPDLERDLLLHYKSLTQQYLIYKEMFEENL